MARAGYDVTYISPGDTEQIQQNVRLLPIPRAQNRLDRFRTMFVALKTALGQRADVYHVHDPELLVALLFIRLVRPHASLVFDSHENFRRYYREQIDLRPRWLRTPLSFAMEAVDFAARLYCTAFVAANPAIAANYPASRTVEVSNFPSLEQLPSAAACSVERPLGQFIYAGTINRDQRTHVTVQALGLLPDDSPAALILAGKFESESYEQYLRSLPGWRRVKFLGFVPPSDVMDAYLKATAAIIPTNTSGNGENARPNKLFECLGCGTPAIVSYQQAWEPFIEKPEAGWFLRDVTPEALAKLMTHIIQFPEEPRRRGQNARGLIESEFNWQREGGKLLALYDRLRRE